MERSGRLATSQTEAEEAEGEKRETRRLRNRDRTDDVADADIRGHEADLPPTEIEHREAEGVDPVDVGIEGNAREDREERHVVGVLRHRELVQRQVGIESRLVRRFDAATLPCRVGAEAVIDVHTVVHQVERDEVDGRGRIGIDAEDVGVVVQIAGGEVDRVLDVPPPARRLRYRMTHVLRVGLDAVPVVDVGRRIAGNAEAFLGAKAHRATCESTRGPVVGIVAGAIDRRDGRRLRRDRRDGHTGKQKGCGGPKAVVQLSHVRNLCEERSEEKPPSWGFLT